MWVHFSNEITILVFFQLDNKFSLCILMARQWTFVYPPLNFISRLDIFLVPLLSFWTFLACNCKTEKVFPIRTSVSNDIPEAPNMSLKSQISAVVMDQCLGHLYSRFDKWFVTEYIIVKECLAPYCHNLVSVYCVRLKCQSRLKIWATLKISRQIIWLYMTNLSLENSPRHFSKKPPQALTITTELLKTPTSILPKMDLMNWQRVKFNLG